MDYDLIVVKTLERVYKKLLLYNTRSIEMNNEFMVMDEEELLDVDGGAVWLVVGGVLVCLGCFALGAYNGYKDTKDQKK